MIRHIIRINYRHRRFVSLLTAAALASPSVVAAAFVTTTTTTTTTTAATTPVASRTYCNVDGGNCRCSTTTMTTTTTANTIKKASISSIPSPDDSNISNDKINTIRNTDAGTTTGSINNHPIISYVTAKDATALDVDLMSPTSGGGYTLEQLMELAGLAVAQAISQVLIEQQQSTTTTNYKNKQNNILVICGPGNNGGDGLVAARHLYLFGYTNITIVYPALQQQTNLKHPHYYHLVQQCRNFDDIIIRHDIPSNWMEQYNVVVDAIFGFSFVGTPRPPYDTIIDQFKHIRFMNHQRNTMNNRDDENRNNNNNNNNNQIIIFAIDVPSGWNVDGDDDTTIDACDDGDVSTNTDVYIPHVLISLTAPKLCSKRIPPKLCRHFVGGRFVPPNLAQKYNLSLPQYPGIAQIIEITQQQQQQQSSQSTNADLGSDGSTHDPQTVSLNNDRSWEIDYANYLMEKETNDRKDSPEQQQQGEKKPSTTIDVSTEDTSWEEQYAAYCAEKEAKLQLLDQEQQMKQQTE